MRLTDMVPLGEEIERARREDPAFRQTWDASAFAREVAVKVVRYRTKHELTQAELGRIAGLTQPAIARLESGEQPPTLKTLAKVSTATGMRFRVDVTKGRAKLVA